MNKKISILGSGRVGASIAYTLTLEGLCSEIVLVDINKQVAAGEALDISQGTPFTRTVDIHQGEYEDIKDSDIVIITLGLARKPGQDRTELAQANVNIMKSVMPQAVKHAPDAIYVLVSNPVDIMTYAAMKVSGLPKNRIFGSGTLLDTSRLKTIIAKHAHVNPSNVHGYVLGEHGNSSVVPWSLTTIAGIPLHCYCQAAGEDKELFGEDQLVNIAQEMRESGATVIRDKGATNYAIAMSVRYLVESILRNTHSVMAISTLMEGEYGTDDVCLSIPCVLGSNGIEKVICPPLTDTEAEDYRKSAKILKDIIATLDFK